MTHSEILHRLATKDASMLGLTASEIDALKSGVEAVKALSRFNKCDNELCGVLAGDGSLGFENLCYACSDAIYGALKVMNSTGE